MESVATPHPLQIPSSPVITGTFAGRQMLLMISVLEATVSKKGKVTAKKAGKVVITVKSAATANYNAATAKITIKVKPKTTSIGKVTSPDKGQIKVTWKKNKTGELMRSSIQPARNLQRVQPKQ